MPNSTQYDNIIISLRDAFYRTKNLLVAYYNMDLSVLPLLLRSIYQQADAITSPSSQVSQGPNVIHIDESISVSSKMAQKKVMTDHLGNLLQWSVKDSAFVVKHYAATATTTPTPTASNNSERLHLKQRKLKLCTQQHGGADALLLRIATTTTFHNDLNWEDVALYALEHSTIVHQSTAQFRLTLDVIFNNSTEEYRVMERKVVQWWLELRGDNILID
jgi:hypothetical protein